MNGDRDRETDSEADGKTPKRGRYSRFTDWDDDSVEETVEPRVTSEDAEAETLD